MRSAIVHLHDERAGMLWQDEEGYHFAYDAAYLASGGAHPISWPTLPNG